MRADGTGNPEHIVIRNDQKLRRVCEREVVGKGLRLHVAVHTDEREILRLAVDLLCDASLLRSEGQSPVRVKLEKRHENLRQVRGGLPAGKSAPIRTGVTLRLPRSRQCGPGSDARCE